MKEALSFSEKLVHRRAKRRNMPEDAILQSHRRENLKSYISKEVIGLKEMLPSIGHKLPSEPREGHAIKE
jgi:hypothetical protein